MLIFSGQLAHILGITEKPKSRTQLGPGWRSELRKLALLCVCVFAKSSKVVNALKYYNRLKWQTAKIH